MDVMKKLPSGLITNNTIRKIEIKQHMQIFFVDEKSILLAAIVIFLYKYNIYYIIKYIILYNDY
jgi:hypothetical protein